MSLKQMQEEALRIRQMYQSSARKRQLREWGREDHFRGFIGDIGALAKLTMAADNLREIPEFQSKLGHEFADCLWSLLVLAHEYEIDLESEFTNLVSELSKKLQPTD